MMIMFAKSLMEVDLKQHAEAGGAFLSNWRAAGIGLMFTLGLAAFKVVFLLSLVLVFGQRLMRWWFTVMARRRSGELFMLNVLLITLGLAWLSELVGLSLALGAFLAGMLIS